MIADSIHPLVEFHSAHPYRMYGGVVALIPARSGSTRIPGKNIKPLAGHPLMAHTIAAARNSGIFRGVYVSTDSDEYAEIAKHYGAEVIKRPAKYATDTSPDIEWVGHAAREIWDDTRFEAYSILRPTSPFRGQKAIARAWERFSGEKPPPDSIRAVRPVSEHPGKCWVLARGRMLPVLPYRLGAVPWHSNSSGSLPKMYVQTAGLEFSWAKVLWGAGGISGESVMPFLMNEIESVDINDWKDWAYAELLLKSGRVALGDPSP